MLRKKFLLSSFLLLLSTSVFAKPIKVLVDPGHGGIDRGAIKEELIESDLVLKVSQKLKALAPPQINIILTRNADKTLGLEERAKLTESANPDLFLSIHANSEISGSVKGVEFYYPSQMSLDEETMFLAHKESHKEAPLEDIQAAQGRLQTVKLILQDLDRPAMTLKSVFLAKSLAQVWGDVFVGRTQRVRGGAYHVLQASQVPAVLVELGYVSHPLEAQWLKKEETQTQMAQAILKGLSKYRDSIDKGGGKGHIMPHAN